MGRLRILVLCLLVFAQAVAAAACAVKAGGNMDMVCSYNKSDPSYTYGRAVGVLSVCSPEELMVSAVEGVLLPSGRTRDFFSSVGVFDEAVVLLWRRVSELYDGGRGYDPLALSCRAASAADLLLDETPSGTCVHWSALLYSLFRTAGVPESRTELWEFETQFGANVVTAYQTDAGGWWVFDVTCCQALVKADDWRSLCGVCACVDGGCISRVTDGGIYLRIPGALSERGVFSGLCGC